MFDVLDIFKYLDWLMTKQDKELEEILNRLYRLAAVKESL